MFLYNLIDQHVATNKFKVQSSIKLSKQLHTITQQDGYLRNDQLINQIVTQETLHGNSPVDIEIGITLRVGMINNLSGITTSKGDVISKLFRSLRHCRTKNNSRHSIVSADAESNECFKGDATHDYRIDIGHKV
jgi:hypothetical protein